MENHQTGVDHGHDFGIVHEIIIDKPKQFTRKMSDSEKDMIKLKSLNLEERKRLIKQSSLMKNQA